jgi:hypothetical protein
MLYLKLLVLCQVRGVTPTLDDIEVRLVAGVETIALWNTAKLGAQPTPVEIAAITDAQALAARRTSLYTRTSRDKDVLATMAMVVRARGIVAWNALTIAQKVAATLAEADVWITIRTFLEDNA